MKFISLFTIFLFIGCGTASVENNFMFSFPESLKEVSGIHKSLNSDLIWTIEDSGNENEIYGLDVTGEIKNTIAINDLENIDWEDLTSDIKGNLYIGDFGNNDNSRKDLAIYQIGKEKLNSNKAISNYKVSFYYEEQTEFPPSKKELFYDCESFFEYNNNFYLFTKNRSKNFDGTTLMYKIPNSAGNHKAVLIGKFKTCDSYSTCAVTSAALSPDNKKIVLLSHNQVWLFEDFIDDAFLNGKVTKLNLADDTQKEGVCFKDNNTIYVSDERSKKLGGNFYQYNLDELKKKQ